MDGSSVDDCLAPQPHAPRQMEEEEEEEDVCVIKLFVCLSVCLFV